MKTPIIKVCGMRLGDNIREVSACDIDMMGFIFHPASPRFVAETPSLLPPASISRIGVFVKPSLEEVERRVKQFALNGVQLHGSVSPELCRELRRQGLLVLKAVAVTPNFTKETEQFLTCTDFFVFDTPTPAHGGSGVTYDWSLLQSYDGDVPFLLSGGLRPALLPDLLRFHHPRLAGYDLNSGFETAPAIKDADAIRQFVTKQRTTN
ncbi:MAG: phosphoribosylanthranilate isomerase [Alloprevotella sp.]